ncbi:MAG TPA: hypothetical protein VFS20_19215 [Longimicrobium sp.]|nr:hypothetical protein [Longimicrobium sp.]
MYRKFFVAAAAAVLAACGDAGSPTHARPAGGPRAEVLLNQRFDLETTAANPCLGPGNFVELSGTLHLLFHVTTDQAGGTHIFSHANAHYDGVDPATGIRYVQNSVRTSHSNTLASGATNTTLTVPRVLVAQGDAPNFTVLETFHLTVNSNGEVTATHTEQRFECRG